MKVELRPQNSTTRPPAQMQFERREGGGGDETIVPEITKKLQPRGPCDIVAGVAPPLDSQP